MAISPGTWLTPSSLRMVINTESTVGYNNKLKRVTPNMKLGVNSDVNSDGTVSVGIKHNFGESKVKLPHAIQHVLRKAVEKVENLSSNKKDPETFEKDTPKSTHKKHELDLILIMIAAMTGAWLLFR